MKEVLAAILGEKFKILKTPESVNTPIGISRLILNNLDRSIQVFIVEMGAYQRGDIKKLCEIARPDIAVLTGINEAHLERFGSLENTIQAKFEIVENAREGALVLLNGEDERVKGNYQRFVGEKRAVFYFSNTPHLAGLPAHPLPQGERDKLNIPLLGEYIWGVLNACGIMAKELGMTEDEIRRGIQNIQSIPHRLQLIENRAAGITVVDDSYNGNPDGVREAIKALSRFEGRRKIYITPGLVEMGERTREIHNEIGKQLALVADIVILIKNSVTPFIEEGIINLVPTLSSQPPPKASAGTARGEGGKSKIIWFDSAEAAHNSLTNILKPGDVILFQNDWPDNYL